MRWLDFRSAAKRSRLGCLFDFRSHTGSLNAPILSSPSDTANGANAMTGSVTTNEAGGTLYWFISTSATPPSAANLKAAIGAVAAGSQSVLATGAQAIADSGLTAATAYYTYFLHRDVAGNDSAVAAADGFTTAALSVSAPVLSNLSTGWTAGDNPPSWQSTYSNVTPYDSGTGNRVRAVWTFNGTPTTEDWQNIDSASLITGAFAWPLLEAAKTAGTLSPGGAFSVYEEMDYVVGDVEQSISAHSNTWSDTLNDLAPSSFTFTDQTGVAASTDIISNAITVAGVTSGVDIPISITGGSYAVDSGSGYGAYTTSAGVVRLGYSIKVKLASSGAASTATNATLTIGGVSDTFTVTTSAAADPLPQAASLGLWLEARTTKLYKEIAATNAVAADGDTVGVWKDLTGNAFDLTAAADDTTRPLFKTSAGINWVEFDGTNDMLRALSALNLWSASGYTAMIAMRSLSPAVSHFLVMQGNSASTNTILTVAGNGTGTASDQTNFYRDDAGTTVLAEGTATKTSAYSGSDAILTIVDDGSTVIAYLDGVAGTSRAYTRGSSVFTMNRFGLGGRQRASADAWFPARVHALAIWPGVVLNSTERAQGRIYLASLQGRTIT